jgi:hypothetical protein
MQRKFYVKNIISTLVLRGFMINNLLGDVFWITLAELQVANCGYWIRNGAPGRLTVCSNGRQKPQIPQGGTV